MDELYQKLLEFASDLEDAQREDNWFKVNGVKNDMIRMVEQYFNEDWKIELDAVK